MILQAIIDVVMAIVEGLLGIIYTIFPQVNLAVQMTEMLAKIMTITTQANNMIHFIIGDFVVILLPLTITLLMYKYIVYPILTFIRSIFVNGNN